MDIDDIRKQSPSEPQADASSEASPEDSPKKFKEFIQKAASKKAIFISDKPLPSQLFIAGRPNDVSETVPLPSSKITHAMKHMETLFDRLAMRLNSFMYLNKRNELNMQLIDNCLKNLQITIIKNANDILIRFLVSNTLSADLINANTDNLVSTLKAKNKKICKISIECAVDLSISDSTVDSQMTSTQK